MNDYRLGQRIAGIFFLVVFWLPLWALLHFAPWWIGLVILFAAPIAQAREFMRALDQFWNVLLLGGIGRESSSSHAGRDQRLGTLTWRTRIVVVVADRMQAGHCAAANVNEQPVMDFIEHPENWTRREGC